MWILFVLSLVPALFSFGFSLLLEKTSFSKLNYWLKQIIIGIVFGGLAILFTEFGYKLNGSTLNIRDSAIVTAGLFFGGPAGIIAGAIGGLYRCLCIYWGGSKFALLACSLSPIMAGLISAGAKKFMFHNKTPDPLFAIIIGAGVEVLHMLLILLSNMSDISYAMSFVMDASLLMIGCNALAVLLSNFAIAGKSIFIKREKPSLLIQSVATTLIICIVLLMAVTGTATYFVNTRLAENEAQNLIKIDLQDISRTIENKGITDDLSTYRIGQSGGLIILDSNENFVLAGKNGSDCKVSIEDIDFDKDRDQYKLYQTKFSGDVFNGEIQYCEYATMNDYYVIGYMSRNEADLASDTTLYMILFSEIIIYMTMFCFIYQIVERKITKKLDRVNDGLHQITQGNLDTFIDVRDSKEFSYLSTDINRTVGALKDLINEAETRNQRELELARQIQMSSVPIVYPLFQDRRDLDIFASMDMAKEVGGDFYDFYFIDNSHLAFLIADVSGKGIPAAMFMMTARTLIKGLSNLGKSVNQIMTQANKELCSSNDADMFLTMWMGILNLETGELEYANAGHNPPLICKNKGMFEYIQEKPNFIMAGMKSTSYSKHEMKLNPGDTIYLYTDGVTEAENPDLELYGQTRLKEILQKNSDKKAKQICEIVKDDVSKFVQDATQSDDMTMLALHINYLKSDNIIVINPQDDIVGLVAEFIDDKLSRLSISTSIKNKVQITIDEIVSNIKKYGSATKIEIGYSFKDGRLAMTFKNDGDRFDPTANEKPDTTLSSKERKIGGLGIYLVEKISYSCEYEYKDGFNCLNVIFDLLGVKES